MSVARARATLVRTGSSRRAPRPLLARSALWAANRADSSGASVVVMAGPTGGTGVGAAGGGETGAAGGATLTVGAGRGGWVGSGRGVAVAGTAVGCDVGGR